MRYVALVFALLLTPFTALAQQVGPNSHLVSRQIVVLTTMLCDTVDQLEAILRANIDHGLRAGLQVYFALRTTPNDKLEPTCLLATYRMTVLETASVWDGVPTPDGGTITAYVLHVLVNGNPYAALSPLPVEPPGHEV